MIKNIACILVCGLLAVACEQKAIQDTVEVPAKHDAEAPAKDVQNSAAIDAKLIFAQRCTLCHGTHGKGDGPAAATLTPKPRDYSDAAWQNSVTDEYLHKLLVEGGAAVGKSMMMPGNPDLKDKPDVVTELVKIVRGFKR